MGFIATDARSPSASAGQTPILGTAPRALLEGFAQTPELEVHVLSCSQHCFPSPVKLAQNIWFHSLFVRKLGWLRSGYLGCIAAVRKKLDQIRPDLVHGQGTERECGVAAVLSGYPNLITIHGNMAELARLFHAKPFGFYWWAARLEGFTLPRTWGVFCNSFYTQELVRPRNSRTWLVPNPLGLAFFEPKATDGLGISIPVFLVIGVVCPRKRQRELLALFQKLQSMGLLFQVRWIGPCPEDSYGRTFQEILRKSPFSGWNCFLGSLDQKDLIKELDSASALVHFPYEESFGLVVAEALARGLKVFAARVGGLREICSGPTGAALISPEDWNGLQETIAQWLRLGYPKPMGSADIMRARYHPSVIAARHVQIYREVIASR